MVKYSLFLFIGFILVLSTMSAEEVCLRGYTDKNSTECLFPARRASKNDVDNLVIMCKIATGVFPFDPRDGQSGRPITPSSNPYGEARPYLELYSEKHEYRSSFNFLDCKKTLNYLSGQIFWATESVLPNGAPSKLVGREFSVNDTERSNTCLGVVNRRKPENTFQCIRRDDFENQYAEPYDYEYLVIRSPEHYAINVTDTVSTEETVENDHVDVGYFSYYNPSEFDQVIEVFLDNKQEIQYGGFEFTAPSHIGVVLTDGDTVTHIEDQYFGVQLSDTPRKSFVPFNITIPAYTSITARIVGRQMTATSVFKAMKEDIYGGNSNIDSTPTEIEGKKFSSYITDFHLEDMQVNHTREVLVLSYSTIYVALMCIGVVLLAGLIVFTIRCAIKRMRRRQEVPYSVINEQAS